MIDISAKLLENCTICPRECHANRAMGELGYCRTGNKPLVASIFLHKGEEPIFSGEQGICNVFFAHCNLTCIYCQNYQISRNSSFYSYWLQDYDEIVERISAILRTGIRHLGFVSPTHQVVQMVEIIERLKKRGLNPVIVYNTNCYDNIGIIKALEKYVDVYLPDIKYFSHHLAEDLSNAPNYFTVAMAALKEMVWQKGTSIGIGSDGLIDSGVVIRHLILPGHVHDSINIMKHLEEAFSANLCISLMSQYYPTGMIEKGHNMDRIITKTEYRSVLDCMKKLGFYRIFAQELNSNNFYCPDFDSNIPFTQ
ncbi:MAG: radical SAM protein [Tenuifilaceae bacterium]|nr:4Fe-4S cluster-binding domain-containing protein [Bacteroidales bacterium]MDI9517685.1 4Fe-4S cluster-binding domain-containing protein [Bacteroidota bacterium]NLH57505.1 4Fe-4S cluster-binding domain-containing protein [Rikenellaceae bacterium]OQC65210.1 MAG: Radical SAM superfamily protein [Bacteroidetes bacterium ADurb.Bin008]HNV81964.1 4Fe-4S cluster-binding domain-containing protein [Tenuifilaceae bacterium]